MFSLHTKMDENRCTNGIIRVAFVGSVAGDRGGFSANQFKP